MENNNGGYSPNPYPYPYPYPNPPPNADPYNTPTSYPPPQPGSYSFHSGSFDHHPPPPPPSSHSGHLYYPPPPSSYPYPPPPPGYSYPQPNLQDQSSFHLSSSSFSHYQGYPPPPPPLSDTSPAYHNQESSAPEAPARILDHGSSSVSSLYSRIDDLSLSANPASSGSNQHLSHSFHSQSSNYNQSSFVSDGSQHGQQIVIAKPSGISRKVLLLHGNLDVWIHEAKNLPNMDLFSKKLQEMVGAGSQNSRMTSDPYVSISVCNAVVGRTFVLSNSENPVWTQHFYVPVAHNAAEVRFLIKDSDVVGSQLIGVVDIPADQIYFGERVEGAFPILNSNGKPCKPGCTLRLSIQYIPIEKQAMYNEGVGAGPEYSGVPGTYFPLRRGGRVTLYQDAHVPDGALPELRLDTGMVYEHGKCWRDIFEAISHARRLVYIVGWSVYHNVKLVRDGGHGVDHTLGDLLKLKSQEGTRVLLLVWDDPTSRDLGFYKTNGLMATHDEEIRRFFKHSSVQVVLCPRSAGKRHSWAKQQETGVIYTHHQKTVIVDADAGYNKRKIIAFVGGLDLCDGRYDTPKHPLFSTLQTVHKDDYHNPTFVGSTHNCPREPWHDLHCKIDGPAAYDVLVNFEERWVKASMPRGLNKLKRTSDDALLKIDRIPDMIRMIDLPFSNEKDPESWHVQVFRSIDSNSVKGFPKDPRHATNTNLVCGKNVLIDMSIHTAYVKAIRAAQHFIYIENQYFLGSSYNWSSHNDLGANNLIPIEIALKIANKIKSKERFAAYIVIPMWPEGVPTGVATQRILYWQNKTMQMMYDTIYRALEEVGLEKTYEPQDYLNFFCLGNREALSGSEGQPTKPCEGNTPQVLAQKSRRFMIYVHSKGMIVDDEYVILGSANINQRSLEGTRDSEIAMGAYQPHHTWARKHLRPHGQIYGYRMSLWAEHTGGLEDCFTCPESLECVSRVRALGEMNWRQFAADEVTQMSGHLLKYPVSVDPRGKVSPLSGCATFPDVGGNITGTFVAIQENLTI